MYFVLETAQLELKVDVCEALVGGVGSSSVGLGGCLGGGARPAVVRTRVPAALRGVCVSAGVARAPGAGGDGGGWSRSNTSMPWGGDPGHASRGAASIRCGSTPCHNGWAQAAITRARGGGGGGGGGGVRRGSRVVVRATGSAAADGAASGGDENYYQLLEISPSADSEAGAYTPSLSGST